MSTMSLETIVSPSLRMSRAEIGRGASKAFVAFAVALFSLAFIMPLAESWHRSTLETFDANLEGMEASVSQGTLARQIGLGSIGMWGLVILCCPGGKSVRLYNVFGGVCLAYLIWCLNSCLWSSDPGLSMKRWVALICQVLGAMAVAKRCTANQFVWIVFSCTLIWLGLGVAAELSLGTFRPWQQGYRFAGIFHPNDMGINCAVLTLSAAYLSAYSRNRKGLWAVATLGFLFLLLTAARTALGTTVVAIAALWILMAARGKVIHRLVVVALAVLWISAAVAFGLVEDVRSAVAMNRSEKDHVTTLTGRVPLWEELLNGYVHTRPLMGHGYGAFWTPNRIFEVSDSQGWAVASSHSSYVDLLLNVGYIGAALYLSAALLALNSLCRLELQRAGPGYGFMAILMIYALVAGLLETTISATSYLSFFVICCVCYLMVHKEEDYRHTWPHDSDRQAHRRFA
jgi:O-antigen ligase